MLDNSCYEGEWKEGLKDGKGIFISSYGAEMYDGSWKLDKHHGFGILEYSGIRYEGMWREGKMEGWGIAYSSDGNYRDGQWKDGKPYGAAIHTI